MPAPRYTSPAADSTSGGPPAPPRRHRRSGSCPPAASRRSEAAGGPVARRLPASVPLAGGLAGPAARRDAHPVGASLEEHLERPTFVGGDGAAGHEHHGIAGEGRLLLVPRRDLAVDRIAEVREQQAQRPGGAPGAPWPPRWARTPAARRSRTVSRVAADPWVVAERPRRGGAGDARTRRHVRQRGPAYWPRWALIATAGRSSGRSPDARPRARRGHQASAIRACVHRARPSASAIASLAVTLSWHEPTPRHGPASPAHGPAPPPQPMQPIARR